MLSKGFIKLVNSLNYKKFRDENGLFIAEGDKLVKDLIKMKAPIKTIVSTNRIETIPAGVEFILCKDSEISKISFLKNSSEILALIEIVKNKLEPNSLFEKLSIGLDGIQDPGNMGTIIRLANWFGIETILCSQDCADIYNPKVVQASMGALLGVQVFYVDLEEQIKLNCKKADYNIYGTFMQGESIYDTKLDKKGMLIMGNEGKGISKNVESLITKRISIPSFFSKNCSAESLNVAVAAGIIISEFSRQSTL